MTGSTNHQDPHALGPTLRLLGHDLRGMLGVLRLEAFSLRELRGDVARAVERGDRRAALAALGELDEIAASLTEVSERGTDLADQVHALGAGLDPGRVRP